MILVRARSDSDAQVWVATNDDVMGLVTEAATPDQLVAKLQIMIPELLEANGESGDGREVPLFVMSEQVATVRLPS